MKIIDFRTAIVSIPFTEPVKWKFGRGRGVSNILIELETDTGLIGLGEAMRYPFVRVVHEILKAMRPVVLGRDPFDHEVIIHELTQVWGMAPLPALRQCRDGRRRHGAVGPGRKGDEPAAV